MTDSSNSPDSPLWRIDPEIVCGHCGHAFLMPTSALADGAATLQCPACRKAFRMDRRFTHDAIEELEKRRRLDPVDQVLADLGRVLGN